MLYFIKKFIPKRIFNFFQPVYHFLLSWLAAVFYNFPSKKMIVIGITGTTGKTTTAFLLAKMLENIGYKVGLTSTAILKVGKKEWLNNKKMTMLGRWQTQELLNKMARDKCDYAIIETTSQGIEQFRHYFINYDTLIFTGIYPEHIEAHKGFENYKKAKAKLFKHLEKCKIKYIGKKKVKKIIIVNLEDKFAKYFLNFWAQEKWGYIAKTENVKFYNQPEFKNVNIVKADNIQSNKNGNKFIVNNIGFNIQILGEFNVRNALAAITAMLSNGISLDKCKNGLEKINSIPGRMEIINKGQDFTIIVDYAFEPRALEKLYSAIKLIKPNRIIHILGSAGGGRDAWRRKILGKLAGKNADIVIVTNEDPYDENPFEIIEQVAKGVESVILNDKPILFKIIDRYQAIKKAISLAKRGDLVLITGKGCEQAICVDKEKKIPWDDRKAVKKALQEIKKTL